MDQYIFRLAELRQEQNETVGKKCANLGELIGGGFKVPAGFAISVSGYERFLVDTGLAARIDRLLSGLAATPALVSPTARADLPQPDMAQFDALSEAARRMVEETEVPDYLATPVREHYAALCEATGIANMAVATRSAGPASHPGQYETYLHVRGVEEVLRHIVKVWSSTFNTRSLVARARAGLPLSYDPIGVAVLAMVEAKAAGVLFTANPADGDPNMAYIESNWGLGESVVGGEVVPDRFVVDKRSHEIVRRTIARKEVWFVVDESTGMPSFQKMSEDKGLAASLSDEEVVALSMVGTQVEEHFGVPQDIEWAVDSRSALPESVYLLQARPIKKVAAKMSTTDQIVHMMTRRLSA